MLADGDHRSDRSQILFVAAESDALPGGKVGGIGDVLRDLPGALADAGLDVTVVLPSYGFLHAQPGAAALIARVSVRFGHDLHAVEVYAVAGAHGHEPTAPRVIVLHNEAFAPCGADRIYCDDPADAPFATDASKYALFGAAVAECIAQGCLGRVDVLHLHDWHAAFVAVLIALDERYLAWRDRRRVFSIHNLALQGVRPFDGHASSLAAWFPWLPPSPAALADPRWSDCFNPMAAGIRLSDRVHTVSPTYAREVLEPNDTSRGFHGGEGLQQDLANADSSGKLVGILNGIDYPESAPGDTDWASWMTTVATELERLIGLDETVRSVDWLAHQRAMQWRQTARPRHVLTSVGRLVAQKAAILAAPMADGRSALEHMLTRHANDAVLVLIGSGDSALETLCRQVAARCPNLLFINRYSAALAELAYAAGDLFVMPSSFEPCGISQMLAMRHGQPCLVHAVGGLVDTVQDGQSGFHFRGDSVTAQAEAMLDKVGQTLRLRETDPGRWRGIRDTARAQRFSWDAAAQRYQRQLYD